MYSAVGPDTDPGFHLAKTADLGFIPDSDHFVGKTIDIDVMPDFHLSTQTHMPQFRIHIIVQVYYIPAATVWKGYPCLV